MGPYEAELEKLQLERELRQRYDNALRQQMQQNIQSPSWGQQAWTTAAPGTWTNTTVDYNIGTSASEFMARVSRRNREMATPAPPRETKPVPLGELIEGIGMEDPSRALEFIG